jgi:hypothetical protein
MKNLRKQSLKIGEHAEKWFQPWFRRLPLETDKSPRLILMGPYQSMIVLKYYDIRPKLIYEQAS